MKMAELAGGYSYSRFPLFQIDETGECIDFSQPRVGFPFNCPPKNVVKGAVV